MIILDIVGLVWNTMRWLSHRLTVLLVNLLLWKNCWHLDLCLYLWKGHLWRWAVESFHKPMNKGEIQKNRARWWGDGKWFKVKDKIRRQVQRQEWKREWYTDKMMGDFERTLVVLIYEVINSREPLYIIWISEYHIWYILTLYLLI